MSMISWIANGFQALFIIYPSIALGWGSSSSAPPHLLSSLASKSLRLLLYYTQFQMNLIWPWLAFIKPERLRDPSLKPHYNYVRTISQMLTHRQTANQKLVSNSASCTIDSRLPRNIWKLLNLFRFTTLIARNWPSRTHTPRRTSLKVPYSVDTFVALWHWVRTENTLRIPEWIELQPTLPLKLLESAKNCSRWENTRKRNRNGMKWDGPHSASRESQAIEHTNFLKGVHHCPSLVCYLYIYIFIYTYRKHWPV